MKASMEMNKFYEYENIQNELNEMTQTQLDSDYAHKLMDRAAEIKKEWNR